MVTAPNTRRHIWLRLPGEAVSRCLVCGRLREDPLGLCPGPAPEPAPPVSPELEEASDA